MDTFKLKEYIYNNDLVEQILTSIGCHHISNHPEYWNCANPNGDNKSAIVIYKNSMLNCINYTKQMSKKGNTDIIDLVSFIKNYSFPESLKYICNEIGLSYYHDFDEDIPESIQLTKLILNMNSCESEGDNVKLKPIDPNILNYYKPFVNDLFYNDGISYTTQKEFGIGYDELTNRISIPIYSEIGDLVGVKGRLFKEKLNANDIKYMYLEKCPKSRILYGLNKTIDLIKYYGKVYVTESEKGVMQLYSYGDGCCVSTGGKTISKYQIEMLTRLCVDIIFVFDKDVEISELKDIADSFPDKIPIYAIIDNDNILNEKESPSDNYEKWKMLKEKVIKIK